MPSFTERIRNGWNAFRNNKDPSFEFTPYTYVSSSRPDRLRLSGGNERTTIASVYNRIALDVASIAFQHVRLDENEEFVEEIYSELDNCLKLRSNMDQSGRAFIQDVVMSMFDEGCVAIVPTDTTANPYQTGSYDILKMRTASIKQWYPDKVRVKLYNERTGQKEEIVLPKEMVAIIENPFYAVMNETNSTLRRLNHKLRLLDITDEHNSSSKMDLIIQLPYVIKSETQRNQAEQRRKDIEAQLTNTKYGIAYTDGTEKIVQLNRSIENQLLSQVEYFTKMVMNQLGITDEIMNGTADEKTMLNYYNRIIEPICAAIADAMRMKFFTKTARTQGQSIVYIRDPFKLVPVNDIAEIADKFTRNEILSSNEVRGIIGFKPSDQPRADELSNKNMPRQDDMPENVPNEETLTPEEYQQMMADLDSYDSKLDELEKEVS